MSVTHYGIRGYGVNIVKPIFDIEKVMKNTKIEISEEEVKSIKTPFEYTDGFNGVDIIEEVLDMPKFEKHSKYIAYDTTNNDERGGYLYYCPSNPWGMTKEEQNLSKDDVNQMIVDILLEISILSEEEIRDGLQYISDGGSN